VNVLGAAKTNAMVMLWGDNGGFSTISRKGDYFRGELAATNIATALWLSITNLAVLNDGNNPDIVTNTVGKTFVAQTTEVFYYDLDGNLTNDGRWTYTWGAENRLPRWRASRQAAGRCTNREISDSLWAARFVIEQWRLHYNAARPHSSLGYQTSAEFGGRAVAGLRLWSGYPLRHESAGQRTTQTIAGLYF
jgi:hypothetical protein